jgi:hypothetical protein
VLADALADEAIKLGWETYYEGKLAMALTDKGLLANDEAMKSQMAALIKAMFATRVATKNLVPALWARAKAFA